jgi:RHS repeat-associated protein
MVTADVALLMNRGDEILLASASREEAEVVPDEAQAAEEIVTAPPVTTPQEKVPAFKLASLWTLGKSPFSQLFRDRSQMDPHDGALADDLDGDVGFLSRPLWDFRLSSGIAARSSSGARTALTTTGSRYFFYTPEMNLMAETELTSAPSPAILYEYIWFGGQPVAQVDSAGTTSWTFTDHLGTPLIQTSSAQGVTWRAEHEPYGEVFALRTADQHQPLRLPGQEAEQLNLGPNGATERSYNIFRWYRPGWGRYTQTDPVGWQYYLPDPKAIRTGLAYGYADLNPLANGDPTGLLPCSGGECGSSAGASGSCCGEIEARKRLINGFLDELEGRRPPSGREYRPGGFTFCAGNRPWIDIDDLRRSFTPCLFPCALAHEQRHAEQCRRFGAYYVGTHIREMERSGYLVELGCLIGKGRGL